MIKPLQLGDGIMTDETKEFASIEDATPTTAIPSETDATLSLIHISEPTRPY